MVACFANYASIVSEIVEVVYTVGHSSVGTQAAAVHQSLTRLTGNSFLTVQTLTVS